MLTRVLSAAVNGIDAFPVEVEVNSGFVETVVVIQTRLDELVGEAWLDGGELSEADKLALDASLADYQKNPEVGSS